MSKTVTVTLPLRLRMLLGIKEGDSLTVEITSRGILLKPKGASAKDIWGAAKLDNS